MSDINCYYYTGLKEAIVEMKMRRNFHFQAKQQHHMFCRHNHTILITAAGKWVLEHREVVWTRVGLEHQHWFHESLDHCYKSVTITTTVSQTWSCVTRLQFSASSIFQQQNMVPEFSQIDTINHDKKQYFLFDILLFAK